MKKLIPVLIVIGFVIFFLPACKKDAVSQDVTPIDTTINPVVTSGPLLKRLYVIDTTVMAGYDTVNRGQCHYDNQNRLIKIESYQTNPTNGDTTGTYSLRYFYNGTDTLAFMTIDQGGFYTNGTLTQLSSDTFYYTFSNGKCISDSSYKLDAQNIPSYAVYQYQYQSGDLVKIIYTVHYGIGLPIVSIYSTTLHQTMDGPDIVHQIDTTIRTFPVTNQWSRTENTVTYLTNPNPISKFSDPIRRQWLRDDIENGSERTSPRKLFSQQTCSFNSMTGSTITNHDQWDVQYTYTLRQDGYPLEYRETYSDNGTLRYLKGVFIYQ